MKLHAEPSGARHGLRARQLSFSYGTETVLDEVELSVAPGSSVAIMGASGSGKSTLLQLLAGILQPSSGEVTLGEQAFSSLPERQRSGVRLREFGFVFQFGELLPELTLRENVELPLLFLGQRRADARTAAAELLSTVGLSKEMNRYVHQVSGGQQQRAALARALVHRPAFVLADEPTGSLDEETASEVLDLLLGVAPEYGGSVVVVTHAPAVARRCTQVLVLRRGRLEAFE